MATQILAGTSGYSYKEWRGHFYPKELAQDQWLAYYASQLPTVEINNTFYRMPRSHVVEQWRDAVPASFRFVLKASRRITHQQRLKDAEEATGYLLDRAQLLGDKLGALLFQLPPYLRADLERLQAFQDLLPEDVPVAFEFRHESWLDADVDAVLAPRQHARVITHDESQSASQIPQAALAYVRLRAFNYSRSALNQWQQRIHASGAKRALVFFKHEDEGAGPAMAKTFLSLSQARKAAPKAAAKRTPRAKKTG